jgi:Flp pilus assembly protein TadB
MPCKFYSGAVKPLTPKHASEERQSTCSGMNGGHMRLLADLFFLFLFFVLLVAWIVVWAALHLAGGLVHLLLIFAVIALIIHLVRPRRTI